uniref:Putative ribonuclease H-like domain-containing protein n=1 Tax=Tanacetum cinerariifolium TaxID=118510 RepID=A0A6L2L1F6_TANCI|nr:putative ribonuclease H-like domain-containing protein [Tanacetum cinerariifolium]
MNVGLGRLPLFISDPGKETVIASENKHVVSGDWNPPRRMRLDLMNRRRPQYFSIIILPHGLLISRSFYSFIKRWAARGSMGHGGGAPFDVGFFAGNENADPADLGATEQHQNIACFRQHSNEFPLPEQLPTTYEDKFPLLIQSDATFKKIALLLKTGYLQHEHYALWEVIKFRDSYESPTTDAATGSASEGTAKKKGRKVALTTEDMQKRKNNVKARTTLLLALPDEHQLRFNKYKTAQELWAAILKTFRAKSSSEKEDVNTASIPTASTNVSPASVNIGADWSFMENEEKDHTLVADEEAPTEFTLMAKTSAESGVFDNSLCSKNCLSQVEGRLVEFKNQKIKFYEKLRIVEFSVECKTNRIENLTNELETLKKEKEGAVPPPAQVYSPPKKNMSWTRLPEFADDTITDYTRPSPSVERNPNDFQNNSSFASENGESTGGILSKPEIKFVRPADSPTVVKTDKKETARKSTVKYAELYRKPSKKSTVRENQRKWNNLKSQLLECIMLGRDFKMTDDTNMLLRTPRQHNMYSIDLNNIVLHKDLTCLVAKASADECMLWHRRLGHLNFKTMNKLVRHNLVRGLPIKFFENDHNCTACLKRKQHKASCKTKLVNSVTKPLHTLHMDLFGPTSVNSLNHKWKGIKREFSNAKTPQQNGVAEKRNRTLIEAARTMVLVNKSQNKTLYELFNGRTPAIGFLKPFSCHIMILNTLDNLGKFEAKGDEGYFIGYSMSSKAFRVFNKRTKRVDENLHVDFLENKPIEKGAGPNWLFDIDSLTNSMNYVLVVVAGANSTNFSGTKEAAGQDVKKYVSSLRYIVLPNWFHETHLESSTSNAQDACNADDPESSGNSNPAATSTNPLADHMETLVVETLIPTVSSPVPTACLNDSPELSNDTRLISKKVTSQDDTPSLDNILTLTNRFEDILGVTTNTDDTNGVEAYLCNMETTISASPTHTLRIHKDHPKSQIIGSVDTPVQTRNKFKEMEEQSFIATIHQKTNPALLQFFLFSCFLSQVEPKAYIGRKNDYDQVFAPVARIEAMRLFLAYASFMGFTVYQMDVKSAFLYGTIDEEAYVMQPLGFQDPEFPARVYKVEKEMYGLHQAPRAWYGTLSKYLLTNGFQRGTIDQTLFIRRHRGDFILVQVYVDDIIFGSSNPQLCREFKALVHENFQMSDMGELNFFVGLQVLQKEDGIGTSKYWGVLRILMISLRLIPLNTDFHPIVDFVEASHLRYALTIKPTVYVSHIRQFWSTAWIETTKEGTKILATVDGRTVPLFPSMLVTMGEGSDTLTEPHHTPSPKAQQTSPTTHLSPSLPPVTTEPLPTVIPSDNPPVRQYTRRARIAQSSALPPVADEPASLLGMKAKGSMQQKLDELMALCTSLQRKQSKMVSKFVAQELEITNLKAKVKLLEDKERGGIAQSGDDALIKGRRLDEGKEAAKRVSDDTEEMATILTSMDAASIITSEGVQVVPTATEVATATISIPTGSGVVSTASPTIPTAAPIFTTATESTLYTRRK